MTADDSLEGIRVWQVGRLAVRPVHHVDVRRGQLHSPCGTARWHICEGTVHRRRGRLSHRHDRPWRSYGDPPGAVARRQILDNGASAPSTSGTSDPSYSRLMLAPTGRPLAEGDGYLSDHYVLFPAVAYGITDNVSLLGGICPREPPSQRGVLLASSGQRALRASASSWPPTATPIGR